MTTPPAPRPRPPAAAPAPAEPPPWPGGVADLFREVLPSVELQAVQGVLDILITVPREEIHRVLTVARTHPDLQFNYLRSLTGVDWGAEREVVYHLWSTTKKHNVTIKTRVPAEDPRLPSAIDIWKAADWHERETHDMFGIVFVGHPNLVPLLLPDDFEGIHPLLRSRPLAPIDVKQGTEVVDEGEVAE